MRGATTLAMGICIATIGVSAGPTFAEDRKAYNSQKADKIKNMSPDERKAFHAERKEKWKAMPKDEKIKMIEKKRAERMKKMDAKWQGMSDDEKINYVEKKMLRKNGKTRGKKIRSGFVAE